MQKFENVDLIETLRQIMQAHTQYYKQDFKYDIDAIQKAAMSDNAEDRNMLWLSRTHGTHCFFEKDVFIKNTSANVAWKHWFEQKSDNPIAYAFEITYTEYNNIYGNLYQLDYEKSVADIKKNAIKADSQILHYENGDVVMDFGKWFSADEHKYYGRYIGLDYIPNDAEKLKDTLKSVRSERSNYPVGNIETHIDDLIKSAVANRIINMTDKEKSDHIELIHYRLDYGDTRNITTFDYALYDALIHTKKPSIKKQLADNAAKDGGVPAKKQEIKIMIWRCNFMRFSVDETKIINMYDTSDRLKLIIELQQALPHIEDAELTETVSALISKLVGMTDTEFNNIDFSAGEDSEVLDSE